MSLRHTHYLQTFVDHAKMPSSHSEVAFVGRSNVGKSSIINTLCSLPGLARVSQTPGRTRTINVFEVLEGRWLIDLPGYGYAVGPSKEKKQWKKMIEGYLLGRPSLKQVFLLIDAYVGPTSLDIQMIEWLESEQRNYGVVCNKIDKIKPSKRGHERRLLATKFGLSLEQLFWVSASKQDGFPALRHCVRELLNIG